MVESTHRGCPRADMLDAMRVTAPADAMVDWLRTTRCAPEDFSPSGAAEWLSGDGGALVRLLSGRPV